MISLTIPVKVLKNQNDNLGRAKICDKKLCLKI